MTSVHSFNKSLDFSLEIERFEVYACSGKYNAFEVGFDIFIVNPFASAFYE